MNYIFSEIGNLKSELAELEEEKAEVIKYIKENIYSHTLHQNSDGTIGDKQKAKACVFLYHKKTYESSLNSFNFPEYVRRHDSKNNNWYDFFTDDSVIARSTTYINFIFELKYVKQVFEPSEIKQEVWQQLVQEGETLLGYSDFKKEMQTAEDLVYLETIEKYLPYKITKIDCPELELQDWFYAIHKSNL